MSGFEFPLPSNEHNDEWPSGFGDGLGEKLQEIARDILVRPEGDDGVGIWLEGGAMIGVSYNEYAEPGQRYHVAFYPADEDTPPSKGASDFMTAIANAPDEPGVFTDNPDEVVQEVKRIINAIAGRE